MDDDGTTTTAATTGAVPAADAGAAQASRRWRSLWRVHFYAGVFAAPFLVMMAVTGLVILYAQPLQQLTQHDVRVVSAEGAWVPFGQQEAAVTAAFPDHVVTAVTVPRDATTSTEFALDDRRSVFVDPYTAEVLGTADPDGGIVGFANRLHGTLNNDAVTIPLPTVAGFFGGDWVQDFVVGDMVLEVLGCWTLVLVASGVYLWWPRRTRNGDGGRSGKALLVPRVGTKGRARWRDLHAIPGILFAAGTAFVIVTGMFWSSYWATGYTALANRITPSDEVEAPSSGIVTRGDLDRFGNHIPWNSGAAAIPDSPAPAGAAPLDIDSVVRIGAEEAMEPGYSVAYPTDAVDEAGNPIYGSWTLTNSWPRKTSEARAVYLDQFTGQTLGVTDVYGYGAITAASDTLVSTHMGTQLGLFSRILMTGICLAVLWSVVSSVVMYVKRRRSGLGLPRRPRDLKLANGLLALMVLTGIVYPLWGVSALLVLGVDRFVIRTVPWLRTTFGQR